MSYELQAFKLIVGLLVLTLTLRLLGKHTIAQLTPYDLVYIIVLGGVLDSSFYNDEVGIPAFLFSVAIWTISIYMIEFLVIKFHSFRILFRGTPDLIIENGKINKRLFKKNNLEMEELRMILRQNGIFSLKEVKDIYIEPDGSFSINKYVKNQSVTNEAFNIDEEEDVPTVLLIDQGNVEKFGLKYIGKSKEWLDSELKRLGINNLSDIVYCEWSQDKGFYYKTQSDVIDE